ncbi:MAG: DMT family transporter [Lachnospiraceae bacterium]|nr:DMT family transporter [Lachnospiraceae bacterium]
MQNVNQGKQKYIGILYIILAGFFFAGMTAFVKLSGDLPSTEKVFWRNAIAIFFAAATLKKRGISFAPPQGKVRWYLIGRATAGFLGMLCNFYAIDRLYIADANMLNKLSPFFAVLFSYFLLKEKIKPYQFGCLLLAFIGALCIMKPSGEGLFTFAAFVGLLGGLGAGLAYTFLRKATGEGVPGPYVVFFFSTFSTLCCIPLLFINFKMPTVQQVLLLCGAGLCATGGQFSITAAYSHAPAREISVFDYVQIIFATIFGILFFGELPDGWSFLGYAFIGVASLTMFLMKKREVVE